MTQMVTEKKKDIEKNTNWSIVYRQLVKKARGRGYRRKRGKRGKRGKRRMVKRKGGWGEDGGRGKGGGK